MVSIVLYCDIV